MSFYLHLYLYFFFSPIYYYYHYLGNEHVIVLVFFFLWGGERRPFIFYIEIFTNPVLRISLNLNNLI